MHLSWINIMADAPQLLAAGLVLFYCCLGSTAASARLPSAQRRCGGRTCRVVIRTLAGELDLIWRRYRR